MICHIQQLLVQLLWTIGHSVGALAADADYAKATSFSAGTTLSGMAFTLTGSETAAGTSSFFSYVLRVERYSNNYS